MIDSNGVLVKYTIDKNANRERVMREFADISQRNDKNALDKMKMRRLEILSEVVDYKYVNKMGNL